MTESASTIRDQYLYGIVLAEFELQAGAVGVQDQPVQKVVHGRVGALVGELEPTAVLGTPQDLLAHTTVLDSVAGSDPVLPLAFGTVVPGGSAIDADVLEPREQEYYSALVGLKGQAQYTLLVRFDRDLMLREIIAENPEAAQLRAAIAGTTEDQTRPQRIRLGELVVNAFQRKQPSEASPILERLAEVTTEMAVREGGQADDVVEVAVLVGHGAFDEFESVVEAMAEAKHERLKFRLVGPQAPYDFVPEL